MNDIFISYRRGDSAGHAGRLFDRLKSQLGAEHVYMDVTDLQPGQDFVVALAHAVAQADCLLAVIGPRWLDASDAAGQRRIDHPEDFVRREVAEALSKGATVIPVLVHGATMPPADALPEALRPLARRQAIELTDARWDSDVQALVQFLAADGQAAATPQGKKPMQHRGRRVGALALVGVTLLAGGSWWMYQATHGSAPGVESRPGLSAGSAAPAQAQAPQPGEPAVRQPRFAIALPALSELRFRTSRAQLSLTLLAIRQEPRDASTQVLTFLVRMLNRGPADEAFGSDQFRLLVGEQSIPPTTTLISAVEALQAKETSLRFVAPSGVNEVALDVRVDAERTRLPVSLTTRTPIRDDASLDEFGQARPPRLVDVLKRLPAALAVGQQVEVGGVGYQLSAAVIERESVEKASLTLTVRCNAPRGSGGVSFGSSTVRLWIDGVPRAPLNFVNLAVDGGHSKEDRFVFDLVAMPQTLEVGLRNGSDSVRIPLPLAALPRR